MKHLTITILFLSLCLGVAAQKPVDNQPNVPVPEAVDLGLSVKWASFNLGASKPEECGNYYKWGETQPADDGGGMTYKFVDGEKLTKYCTDANCGTVDGKTTLEAVDDAATITLGGKWRMPTNTEIDELVDKCTSEQATVNGMSGLYVTGPNGNRIFLPAAGGRWCEDGKIDAVGYGGTYWSSSTAPGFDACALKFRRYLESDFFIRANAFPIRPVLAE